MNDRCEYFRESIREAMTSPLSGARAGELDRHIETCAACRSYAKRLAADDALLTGFAERMTPVVAGIERAVLETIEQKVPVASFRRDARIWRRGLRLAVAAVIACGLMLLAAHLLPPGTSSVTLAEVVESMRRASWIHVVQTTEADEGHRYEYWECFRTGTLARKTPDGKITYADHGENVMYAYNPRSNRITVSFTTDNYMVRPLWNPLAALSEAVRRTEAAGAEVSRRDEVDNGVRVERIQVDYPSDVGYIRSTYVRDIERNRLLRQETIVCNDGRERAYATAFDYPEQGPENIYALGVPHDAGVVDIRPEGPALALVEVVQERFERGFGDHVAVVLKSWVAQDGASKPSEVAVLWQKGDLKRADVYRAYDFQDRPGAPVSLNALVEDAWPDLTIPRVLEIVDANALRMRMLFDGQRTTLWCRDGRQMIREEHRTDQFKVLHEPLTRSLTGLIWPNLHVRLQSGSSQFKREVRLLPEDPNRPGLVGLQFVEFALREDYWFDPDKDHMRIERVEKQEGQGVTSRFVVARCAQTAAGRWYPQVVQTESSPPGAATVRRQEFRVLLDVDRLLDESVFDPAAWTTQSSDGPEASTAQRRTEAAEPNDIEAQGTDGTTVGIAGRVTDRQGRPVAGATVLLYHIRNRWGLGNKVVEQTQTSPQGGYALVQPLDFQRSESHAYAQDMYVLIAMHPDYAFAWQNIRQGREKRTYDLTLTAPRVRTITVTDHDGNPLPGARVWLYNAGDRKSYSPLFRDYVSLPTDIGSIGAVTDASGCAVVTNLPDTGCSFHATLDGYATGLAFSGQDRIRLSPGADVSGWVLTESGAAVGGATVAFKAKWMHQYFLAESDAEGRFVFTDLPARGWDMGPWGESEGASGAYKITVKHDDYAGVDTDIELLPGQNVEDLVISVSGETTLVRCLVLETGTDRPVAGARISGDNQIGSINGYSDANGIFTVRALPGPVSLRFYSPPDGVYVVEEPASGDYHISFDAEGGEMDVTLRAPAIAGRLCSVRGTVHDPQGLAVSNAVVYAAAGRFNTATATGYVRPAGADTNGQFELKEVPAGRDLHLYAETKDRMLAFADVFAVPADPNELEPLELILQPTATAVTVIKDEQGTPAANTSLEIAPMIEGERIWPAGRRGQTDHLGTLKIDGIVPGLTYHLRDARFDQGGPRPKGWEEWFKRVIVLIPLD